MLLAGDTDEATPLAVRVSQLLQEATAAGVCMSDFKLENVVVGADGRLRLIDLDGAQVAPAPAASGTAPALEAWLPSGSHTAHCVAPEQLVATVAMVRGFAGPLPGAAQAILDDYKSASAGFRAMTVRAGAGPGGEGLAASSS